jgi:primosomal protein N' (replication factor Y)
VRAALDRGDQALLFLNRRGYAPVTLCRACGAQIGCPDCDARMVEHRFLRQLMCHQCGRVMDIPDACPECGAADRLAALGPGVERLQEEAAALFPEARIAVLSSDLFGSARALKARLAEIAEGGADIVIGTQLVAKGHNFPLLTLVGVIDADLALGGADLRAAERDLSADASGGGPGGPGRPAGPCAAADLPARSPGDPGHSGRRRRGVLGRRGGRAPGIRHAALRPAGGRDPCRAPI